MSRSHSRPGSAGAVFGGGFSSATLGGTNPAGGLSAAAYVGPQAGPPAPHVGLPDQYNEPGGPHYWRVHKPRTGQAADGDSGATWWLGIALLTGTLVFFVVCTYWIVIAPFMPETGNPALDFFRDSMYYSLLVPLLLPTTFVAVYLMWASMKFFRHN